MELASPGRVHRRAPCRIFPTVSSEPQVPPPPEDPEDLLAWADAHQVSGRLDDVLIGSDGPSGTFLPGRNGEMLTYRQILLEGDPASAARRRYHDSEETARTYLHRN